MDKKQRSEQRLRQAQAVADDLRLGRTELFDEAAPAALHHVVVVDFHNRRALHGVAAEAALFSWIGRGGDAS